MKKYSFNLFGFLLIGLVFVTFGLLGCSKSDNVEEGVEKNGVYSISVSDLDLSIKGFKATSIYNVSGGVEGKSIFKWYQADDAKGTNSKLIEGENQKELILKSLLYRDKFFSVELTPVQNNGTKGEVLISGFKQFRGVGAKNGENSHDKLVMYHVKKVGNHRILQPYTIYNVPHILKKNQRDLKGHQEMWDLVSKISTPEYLDLISEFVVYDANTDRMSSKGRVLGYVVPARKSYYLEKWQFGLGIDYYNEKRPKNHSNSVETTIVHELMHIVSLEQSQINSPNVRPYNPNCEGNLPEGCPKHDSYMLSFYKTFWKRPNFYSDENFVSKYASTNVVEDMAETMRVFVLEGSPNSNKLKYQKIRSYANTPKLKRIRDYMRKGFDELPIRNMKGSSHRHDSKNEFSGCGTSKMMAEFFNNNNL